MYVRKFKHSPEQLLEQGKNIIQGHPDGRFYHRVSMVNILLSGTSANVLSELSGIPVRTLQYWVQIVDERGFDALKDEKRAGRPPRLSEKDVEDIRAIVQDEPSREGYRVWDGPSLADYIRRKYNIEFSVSSAERLLHKMGMSSVRATTRPSRENPDVAACGEFET